MTDSARDRLLSAFRAIEAEAGRPVEPEVRSLARHATPTNPEKEHGQRTH